MRPPGRPAVARRKASRPGSTAPFGEPDPPGNRPGTVRKGTIRTDLRVPARKGAPWSENPERARFRPQLTRGSLASCPGRLEPGDTAGEGSPGPSRAGPDGGVGLEPVPVSGVRVKRLLPIVMVLVVVATACSSGTAGDSTTTMAPSTTLSSTTTAPFTTTTLEVTARAGAAGIWLADLGLAHLQFRLEAGPDGTVVGVFDSPDEGVTDIALEASVDGDSIVIDMASIGAVFEGTVSGETLEGVWHQSGVDIPLVFARRDEPFRYARSQEPQPPFPYTSLDVTFPNLGFDLAGTLVVPDGDGPFSTVVLVSGSGPQDRDETLVGHKPFLVLADALARAGIASLRYDDRGVGESGGSQVGATTEDLATDAAAAVSFLAGRPEVGSLGIVGHSEGGMIAPMVAVGEPRVDFIVLLAGPGVPGVELLARQTADMMRAEGVPQSIVDWRISWTGKVLQIAASDAPADEAEAELRSVVDEALAAGPAGGGETLGDVDQFVAAFTDPWMRWFLAYDPAPALSRVEVPVLAMIGGLDLQVAAATNLPALEEALASNADATVVELEGLNHLFQPATTGAASEYARIDVTFDPDTMGLIAGWILDRS